MALHSCRNGMESFHSCRNGVIIPFLQEWNDSIPFLQEYYHYHIYVIVSRRHDLALTAMLFRRFIYKLTVLAQLNLS